MRFLNTNRIIAVCLVVSVYAVTAAAQSKRCTSVGGMVMTNLGAVDAATTMGTATGDLRGAVGATILSTEASGNTLALRVQHHWVTESGDTLNIDPAVATTTQVSPGLYAIVTYPVHLRSGTGKFAGATGDLTNIGEADLVSGQIVLRYSGKVCFAKAD
jgi:hypothetical protein